MSSSSALVLLVGCHKGLLACKTILSRLQQSAVVDLRLLGTSGDDRIHMEFGSRMCVKHGHSSVWCSVEHKSKHIYITPLCAGKSETRSVDVHLKPSTSYNKHWIFHHCLLAEMIWLCGSFIHFLIQPAASIILFLTKGIILK